MTTKELKDFSRRYFCHAGLLRRAVIDVQIQRRRRLRGNARRSMASHHRAHLSSRNIANWFSGWTTS